MINRFSENSCILFVCGSTDRLKNKLFQLQTMKLSHSEPQNIHEGPVFNKTDFK